MSYVICTSPRSGSNLLSSALWQTGIAGRPSEYFNIGYRDEFIISRQLGITAEREYVPALIRASTTSNGVFGTKLHAFQTWPFLRRVSQYQNVHLQSLRAALEAVFPNVHYIFLTRQEKMRQAVSYYRAIMTNEWVRKIGEKAPPHDTAIEFDHFAIDKCRALIEASDLYWEGFFEKNRITPLRLTYEELTEQYDATVRSSLRFLGLSDLDMAPPPAIVKLANERSNAWEQRLLKLGELYSPADIQKIKNGWPPA